MHAILNEVVTLLLEGVINNLPLYDMQMPSVDFVLCTGDVMLERVSPRVIVLDPPEKLVIETRASGGYRQFDWQRNGNPFTLAQGQPFTATLQEFPNFFEIFVRDTTTANDLGVYEVDLVLNAGSQVPDVDFTVTPYSKYRLLPSKYTWCLSLIVCYHE